METERPNQLPGCLLVWATLPFLLVLEGLILTVLWDWFIVPLGIAGISIPVAIGIALIAGLLTHQHDGIKYRTFTETANKVLVSAIWLLEVLAIGYIVKLCM